MASSFYDVLGVPRDATADQIKKRYRALAREHHPDKGGDAERFKTVQAAYDVLSSEEERRAYDQLGHERYTDMKAGGGPSGPQGGGHPFHDMFFDMFGGGSPFGAGGPFSRGGSGGPQQAAPVVHTLRCTLHDVMNGFRKSLNLTMEIPCLDCQAPCVQCRGTGVVQRVAQMGFMTQIMQGPCDACEGRGQRRQTRADCSVCRGAGCTRRAETLEVALDPGFDSAARVVFAGKGTPPQKRGDVAGDLVIQMAVDESAGPWRRRGASGSDIVLAEPVALSWRESVVGRVIQVPFIGGTADINTADWGILKPDTEYRIRGCGLPAKGGGPRGDAYIRVRIEWPETAADIAAIRALFQK